MARVDLERLSGEGTLHAADHLLRRTRYELTRWSISGADTGSEGAPRIDGRIDISGIAEAVVLAGPDQLVLTLEDGRRLAVQLTASDGAVVARAWLPPE